MLTRLWVFSPQLPWKEGQEISHPLHTSCRLPNVQSAVRHKTEGRAYWEDMTTGCVACPMGLCGPKTLESKAAVRALVRTDKAKA